MQTKNLSPEIISLKWSLPRLLLHLEGGVVLLAAAALYATQGYSWFLFALLFFAPDLFILGYLRGKEFGSMVYNLGHTYAVPSLLVGLSLLTGWAGLMPVAIIWLAHIGMDRAVGYGLKYPDSFQSTHLSRV